jgi:hypothetical protein
VLIRCAKNINLRLGCVRKMSFIEIRPDSDFSLQNLPYGVFSTKSNVSIMQLYQIERK